jgi:hypothetical protein
MVNLRIFCPHYDYKNKRKCKEKFEAAIPEQDLYTRLAKVRCPGCRNTITLNNDRYFVILDVDRPQQQDGYDRHVGALRGAQKRGKYSAKQRKEQRRHLRRRDK